MKINNIANLCLFVSSINGCAGAKCTTCPLYSDNIYVRKELNGTLEVVKECEHVWAYYTEARPYNNKILRKCVAPGGCGLHDVRWFKDIDADKLDKLFEE